jgi:hypothetical protein
MKLFRSVSMKLLGSIIHLENWAIYLILKLHRLHTSTIRLPPRFPEQILHSILSPQCHAHLKLSILGPWPIRSITPRRRRPRSTISANAAVRADGERACASSAAASPHSACTGRTATAAALPTGGVAACAGAHQPSSTGGRNGCVVHAAGEACAHTVGGEPSARSAPARTLTPPGPARPGEILRHWRICTARQPSSPNLTRRLRSSRPCSCCVPIMFPWIRSGPMWRTFHPCIRRLLTRPAPDQTHVRSKTPGHHGLSLVRTPCRRHRSPSRRRHRGSHH